TADGGPRDWACKGVRQHRWCPPAFGTRNLGRAKPAGRHRYVFFGGSVRGIHGEHRARLLDWAKRRWGSRFGWYGQATRGRKYGAELSGLVSYADVVLGDSAGVLPRCDESWPCYWSDRVARMMGRGAVFAHPATTGMARQGFDGTTMVPFRRYARKTIGEPLDSMSTSQRAAARTVAQALKLTADVHVTTPPDERYTAAGCEGAVQHVLAGPGISEYDSTRDLWSPNERTVLLYGDVYFTAAALQKIAGFNHPR